MPIIGTAGHVDHGKSTLIKALTGKDPDRWQEEKERGLTIDLGFAWTELRPGMTTGFVDVPGHERFMKNMLAGVGALDAALLVVAADQGWMPQTEEHFSVLKLLGIKHGVIALTRSDLASKDTLELVQLELEERIAATLLQSWPVVITSAVTGAGIDLLRKALANTLERSGTPQDRGRPRLWIDRSFSISGTGLVVTGTLTGGIVHQDMELNLFPGSATVRVRGLQIYEREVESVQPGTRVAINLAGLEREDVTRGSLLAAVGQARESTQFLVQIHTVRSIGIKISSRGAFHLHAGSGAWPMQLIPVSNSEIANTGHALIRIPVGLPLKMGDRFIVREVGRRTVVAGGQVLDPAPRGRLHELATKSQNLVAALKQGPHEKAQALLNIRECDSLLHLEIDSDGGKPEYSFVANEKAISEIALDKFSETVESTIRFFQAANPLRPGMPRASIATKSGIDPEIVDAVLSTTEDLIDNGRTVHTADFTGSLGSTETQAWNAARAVLTETSLAVPRASQIGLSPEVLHALIRSEELIRVAENLVYLPEQIDEVISGLKHLEDPFTVAEFRDTYAITRRQAVPLLEWLDANGWTIRQGNLRSVKKQPGPKKTDVPPQ